MTSRVSIHAPARGATRRGYVIMSHKPRFQFTRPQGARQTRSAFRMVVVGFQFTRPQGARRAALATPMGINAFQFTRPQGARHGRLGTQREPKRFNSRARKGRDRFHACAFRPSRCFNSRARKGRDMRIPDYYFDLCVSIHAPARGATTATGPSTVPRVFQFTRPQGARPTFAVAYPSFQSFNSRARKGRDMVKCHAEWRPEFQFTRPQGARLEPAVVEPRLFPFQFTRPQGARHCLSRLSLAKMPVSIHAPARGATSAEDCSNHKTSCFNSRARKGRDTTCLKFRPISIRFQFTRPQGARHRQTGVRP